MPPENNLPAPGNSFDLPIPGGSSPAPRLPVPLEVPPIALATPPPAFEDLGQLPVAYGTKKLFLVPRDPDLLFAYWDLAPEQYQEAAHSAHDGKIFLEFFVPGEGRVQQLHVWDSHKNWYLQVNRPDTAFFAQLGYYRVDGGFTVLARSGDVRTPRRTLSPNLEARFVTIPFHISFQELHELIAQQILPGEALVETMARLQQSHFELPFQARLPVPLAPEETAQLAERVDEIEVRRTLVGSFEITELLRKRFETALSSGQWGSSPGGWVTSVSSPAGGFSTRERGFHLHVNAELILYGGTEPSAKVRVDGKEIALSPDGTFAYHFVFPDGKFHIPISATSADGVETREALLSFLRLTATQGDVRSTGQPPLAPPLGRED